MALPARELGIARERAVGGAHADEIAPLMFDDGDADAGRGLRRRHGAILETTSNDVRPWK